MPAFENIRKKEKIMSFDPRTEPVTLRIVLKGVMLMCINKHKWCELGVIQCPHHPTTIDLRTTVGGVVTVRPLLWPSGHDLIFNVKDSQDKGVSKHPKAIGDYAFSKILDLEGTKCHKQQLPILTHRLDGRRLGITAGRLYTHRLTQKEMRLLTWTRPDEEGEPYDELGRIAREVGINIRCYDVAGAGIDILDAVTGELLDSLPVRPDTSYEIDIENDCSSEDGPKSEAAAKAKEAQVGSDFRYLYNIAVSPTARKFDLDEIDDGVSDPFPGVCEATLFSKTDSFGLT
jgi:hypothetical protein